MGKNKQKIDKSYNLDRKVNAKIKNVVFWRKTCMIRAFSFGTYLNEVKFRDFVNENLSLILSSRELNFASGELKKFGESYILQTVSEIK